VVAIDEVASAREVTGIDQQPAAGEGKPTSKADAIDPDLTGNTD
jgi:hypothetical protein